MSAKTSGITSLRNVRCLKCKKAVAIYRAIPVRGGKAGTVGGMYLCKPCAAVLA